MRHFLSLFLVSVTVFAAPKTADIVTPKGITTLKNAAALREKLGLEPYFADRKGLEKKLQGMTIAILDDGFGDIDETNVETYLPKGSVLVRQYDRGTCAKETVRDFSTVGAGDYRYRFHGMHMAQAVWALTGFHKSGPKFVLYNANGTRNFQCAVRDLVDFTKPQLVLFSGNWETLGNYNGTGPLNDAVAEAVDEGMIWINAAGNYGGLVRNARLNPATVSNGWYRFAQGGTSYLDSFTNSLDDNEVTIKLSWNDNGTNRKLGLALFDKASETSSPIARGEAVEHELKSGDKRVHAMQLTTRLKGRGKQKYYLGVSQESGEFTAKDRIRITILHPKMDYLDPDSHQRTSPIEYVKKSEREGEIMDPASGSGLTIGSFHDISAIGPTRDERTKPEIILDQYVASFTDDFGAMGTSYSAAYFLAIATILKAQQPGLRQEHLLKFRSLSPDRALMELGFATGTKVTDALNRLPELIRTTLASSASAVTTGGRPTFVVNGTLASLSGFSSQNKEVVSAPSDYRHYLVVKETPTTQRIQVDRQGPYRTVTVRNGYYEYDNVSESVRGRDRTVTVREGYWKYKIVGEYPGLYYNYANGTIDKLVIKQPYWVEPETRTEPTYQTVNKRVPRWVEPVTRQEPTYYKEWQTVPGEPIRKMKWVSISKDETKDPSEVEGGSPSEYVEVRTLTLPPVGGDVSEPRYFETPDLKKLETVVKRGATP